ncbi:hypothetical protein [Comamonas sp. JNW]|uniref:hypothetical protein n=1 Tax=Comamonas sp. JNW TaxID=2170731 RepID=UPI000DE665B3|nr:hypothetical protein [Comamonas sp. JNW]PWB21366.1 hypothetical protein DCO45_02920 [Comamonas sp. JNW]
MTDKTEAQPEALRLAEAKRYSEVVHHANVKASLAYVARKTGLGYQETERLLELALQRGDLAEGDYSGRKMENTADDRLASLEAQLVAQANRASAAEQQVTALTQRLDMANRLNTDARNELALANDAAAKGDLARANAGGMELRIAELEAENAAIVLTIKRSGLELLKTATGFELTKQFKAEAQLSARQAAPDGWRLVPVEVVNLYDFMCLAFVPMTGQHEQIAISLKLAKAAMLSAAPPPPEREPLTQEQKDAVIQEWIMSRVQGATND